LTGFESHPLRQLPSLALGHWRLGRESRASRDSLCSSRLGSNPTLSANFPRSRSENSNSGEFAEPTRGWTRCACVIFLSGTLAGRFSCKRTAATTWDEARAYAAAIEAVGSWSHQPAPAVAAPDAPATPTRITIEEATSIFLANRESAQIAPATLRKYRTFTKQLTAEAVKRRCR